MLQSPATIALFRPNEYDALFNPRENELVLSREGLYYLGVFGAPSADTAA
jgi:hypothetical protein